VKRERKQGDKIANIFCQLGSCLVWAPF
jgi:hypothetical protein